MTKAQLKGILEFYKAMGIEQVPRVSPLKEPNPGQGHIPTLSKRGPHELPPFSKGGRGGISNVGIIKTSSLNEKKKKLSLLREKIGDCKKCKLAGGRTNLVFGEGNPDAEILFIGEAPGREEDLQGRPFVGDAGRILTELIEWMRFKREQVFIANICKCRPPGNRDPEEDEVRACIPYLKEQIETISPKVILALGRVSAQNLLNTKTPIGKLRGNVYEYGGIPLVPTFHPAYILRSPGERRKMGEDARVALNLLRRKGA